MKHPNQSPCERADESPCIPEAENIPVKHWFRSSAGELPAFGRYVGGAGVVPAAQPAILQQLLGRTKKPASA